jgi:hypothetical protein
MDEKTTQLLNEAVNATQTNSVAHCFPNDVQALVTQGLIEVNDSIRETREDGQFTGRVAMRATQAGIAAAQNQVAATAEVPAPAPVAPAPAPVAPAPVAAPVAPAAVEPAVEAAAAAPAEGGTGGFAIVSGFVPPKKQTRRVVKAKYPFADLDNGGAFFVPATEERPDPKKSMASTISSANNKFKEFEPSRYFKSFAVLKGEKFGDVVADQDGCYVVRMDEARPATVEAAE